MIKHIKKIWKDPVGATLISAGILAFLGWLGNQLSDGRVWSALQTIWGWIESFLFLEVAVIWIIVGFVVLVFCLYLWANIKKWREPLYLEYKSDVIRGFKYRWTYNNNYTLNLNSITLLCPNCETPMNGKGYILESYYCARCNNSIDASKVMELEDLTTIIRDNIRRKYGTK